MSQLSVGLEITTAPFTHQGLSTRRLMLEVLLSLIPVVAASVYFFGISALLVTGAAVVGAAGTEMLLTREGEGERSLGPLRDGSAILTGILLALTLPPAIPLWMAFLGGAVSIGLGKAIWGGLGENLFNPALVGRAFLQAAFPLALTTWAPPKQGFLALQPSTLAPPFFRAAVDGTTMATPLGLAKFEGVFTDVQPLLTGATAGSLGETAGGLLLVCGLYLGIRRVFDWRLTLSTLTAVAASAGALYLWDSSTHPDPLFELCSGGLLFGAVYMVTDPVTSPITPKGAWVFGAGVGTLVVLIRAFGGLAEGVMYAILLMNSVTPLINRFTQSRRFGG